MLRVAWPCKDGAVAFFMMGGVMSSRNNALLAEWIDSEGMADDVLKAQDWAAIDMETMSQEAMERLEEPIGRFFLTHTKAEIYEGARERGIQIAPVNTVKDLAESVQLAGREYWEEVEHPELNATITYPGAFIRATETPCNIRRRAPLIGEHNEEVYQELGITGEELLTLKQCNII